MAEQFLRAEQIRFARAATLCVTQAYVNTGKDVTTPEQAFAALTSNSLSNTIVSLVDFDTARLKELGAVFGRSPVAGSSQIRHAVYTPEGVLVYRHAGFTQSLLIPQAYAAKVVGIMNASANGTLSGVKWDGQDALLPRLSRHWKADKKEAANAATTLPEYLPFVLIRPEALEVEFLRCICCDRLFVSVRDYALHSCPAQRAPQSVLPSARALAFAASSHQSSAAPRALLAPAAGALPLPAGWARHPPRDTEKLDDTSVFHLTQWFDEGNREAAYVGS
jgi:hypothetical protein